MILVSGDIRRMRIFADIHCQMTVMLSTTAIFGDLGGYIFRNVRAKTSNITWGYATLCRPLIATWMT